MSNQKDFITGVAKKVLAQGQSKGFKTFEVIVNEKSMTEMQMDAGAISLLRNTDNVSLTLRAIKEGRYATFNLNQLDESSIEEGFTKLNESLAAAPVDPARAFAPKQAKSRLSKGPAEPSLESMYETIAEFSETTKKSLPTVNVEMAGLQFNRSHEVRLNTEGLELETEQGFYAGSSMFSGKEDTGKDGMKTSSFNFSGGYAEKLDRKMLEWGSMRRLMESSAREVHHQPFKGKFTGPVVLSPDAFWDLFSTWSSHLADGLMIAGTSQLKGKVGEKVASEAFSLRYATGDSRFSVWDLETADGYVSEPSTLLEKGVLCGYLLSDYGARKTGFERAKNSGQNVVIAPGKESLQQLVGKIPRGLFIQRLSFGMPSANGDFSGVAKNSYLIEAGEVATPLSEVMISGNLFDLMKSISAVSSELINDGSNEMPFVVADGVTIAGQQ